MRACVPILGATAVDGTFKNVQFAPGLTVNLLSVAAMTAQGLSVTFKGQVCTIRNQQNKVIGSATQVANKLYQLSLTKRPPSPVAAIATEPAKPDSAYVREWLSLLHNRLGHASHASVRKLFAL